MEGTRTAVTRPLHTSYFGEVHLLHTNSILDLFEVIDDVASDPSERHVPPLLAMEETLHRTIWSGSARRTMRSDAGQRAAGGMWVVAVGNWESFFLNLPNDPFAKNWYHDSEGHKLCTMLKKSNPFLDGFRKWVLHAPKEGAIPSEACSLGEAATTLFADARTRQKPLQGVTPNAMIWIRCRAAACLLI